MQKLEFNIKINAPKEKVWLSLWDEENYKIWTNEFCAGTYYKINKLKQGNIIHFLSPDGGGMYSIIETLIEYKLMIFRHIGELLNFEEQPLNENTKKWTNAIESYELMENENETTLIVKVDTVEEYVDYMKNNFPKALQALKNFPEN